MLKLDSQSKLEQSLIFLKSSQEEIVILFGFENVLILKDNNYKCQRMRLQIIIEISSSFQVLKTLQAFAAMKIFSFFTISNSGKKNKCLRLKGTFNVC